MCSESQTQAQSHFTMLLRKLPGALPACHREAQGPEPLSPRTVYHLSSPQRLPCPGVSCLSQLLGCISADPVIPTPLLCPPCSSINVTLGAHNIKQQERTQQVIQVRRAIRHPDYKPKTFSNDIMLLQARKTPHWPCPPEIRSLPSQELLPSFSFPSWPPDQSQGER